MALAIGSLELGRAHPSAESSARFSRRRSALFALTFDAPRIPSCADRSRAERSHIVLEPLRHCAGRPAANPLDRIRDHGCMALASIGIELKQGGRGSLRL